MMRCVDCGRVETDPIFLDVERCGICGEFLEDDDDKNDDGQPDEQQEWHDYDPDC